MTSEHSRLLKKLNSRTWRLNNLYWVEDKNGQKVKFRMNWAQRAFLRSMWFLNVILKARQLGMSTFMSIYMLDRCLFAPNQKCGIIDRSLVDAKKKLAKIRFAYENLDDPTPCDGPNTSMLGAAIKEGIQIETANKQELGFSNNSAIWADTSLRGGTIQVLHISELGYIASNDPKRAEEIRSGALNTVHAGNIIVIESTHEGGKTGLNYEMIVTAQEAPAEMSRLDWKFHFFPWWRDPEYTLPDPKPVTDGKLVEYFTELQVTHGILLTPGQQAWYAAKARTQKQAMKKEYPSTPEEAVNVLIRGAIYGEQISQARAQGRVCDFAVEQGYPIYVAWDIGATDFTDLWFIQPHGIQHRVLDFYENRTMGIAHYVEVIRAWERKHGVSITLHLLPHDAGARQIGVSDRNGSAISISQQLNEMGMTNIAVVPRTPDVWIGINRLRAMLPQMVFHRENCSRDRVKEGRRYPSGLGALESYRTFDDSSATVIKEMPVHDDTSHAADALRTYAEGYAHGMVSTQFAGSGQAKKAVKVVTGRQRDDDDDDFPEAKAVERRSFRKIRVKR